MLTAAVSVEQNQNTIAAINDQHAMPLYNML